MAEWKRGGPTLSLVLVEIDQFHAFARAHGPKFRDQLVVSLARIVFAGVREMDMVARYSSGCLGLLLPRRGTRRGQSRGRPDSSGGHRGGD